MIFFFFFKEIYWPQILEQYTFEWHFTIQNNNNCIIIIFNINNYPKQHKASIWDVLPISQTSLCSPVGVSLSLFWRSIRVSVFRGCLSGRLSVWPWAKCWRARTWCILVKRCFFFLLHILYLFLILLSWETGPASNTKYINTFSFFSSNQCRENFGFWVVNLEESFGNKTEGHVHSSLRVCGTREDVLSTGWFPFLECMYNCQLCQLAHTFYCIFLLQLWLQYCIQYVHICLKWKHLTVYILKFC